MNAVELRAVTKQFGQTKALRGVSLAVEAGSIYGFLGPNGAGKTTSIRLMMGFTKATSGQVRILGRDAWDEAALIKRQVGFVPSDNQLYLEWSARRHVELWQQVRGPAPMARKLADQLELPWDRPLKHLSSGNRQKVALILALMHQPKLIIMDEPSRALDPLLQEEMYTLLRRFRSDGGTVFLSSHNLTEVEKLCDEVGIIRSGEIVASKALADLRNLKIHLVTAVFERPVPAAALAADNAELMSLTGATAVVKVKGDITPFMQQVVKHKLRDLEVTHQGLEEIFMEYYRG